MDLNEYSSSKVVKAQRARQPNWSEHEKQLFLALTRKHHAILENKGRNSMIWKSKLDTWIEIASHMNGAGYYRSINKLKQQLGRIRAAEAKEFKKALEKSAPSVVNYANTNDELPATHATFTHEENKENTRITTSPNIVANNLDIKVKVTSSTEDESNNAEPICPSQTLTEEYCRGTDSQSVQKSGIRLVAQNLKSQDTLNNARKNHKDDVLDLTTATDLVSPLAVAENDSASNLKTQSIDNVGCNVQNQEREVKNKVTPMGRILPKNRASCRVRLATLRILTTTEQRNRQILKYRVAIQRERLYALKMQQKRDRMLHRKEVEIQNLRLQLVRNQEQFENRIKF